jgi:hypothetical protein
MYKSIDCQYHDVPRVVLSGFNELEQVGIDLVRVDFVLIRLVPSFCFGC